jgi:hypothetical protein
MKIAVQFCPVSKPSSSTVGFQNHAIWVVIVEKVQGETIGPQI